jgi:hypothetical protein
MNNKQCDICLYPEGKIKKFIIYQPTTQKDEIHFVCEKCIKKLIEKHFSLLNVL